MCVLPQAAVALILGGQAGNDADRFTCFQGFDLEQRIYNICKFEVTILSQTYQRWKGKRDKHGECTINVRENRVKLYLRFKV